MNTPIKNVLQCTESYTIIKNVTGHMLDD